MKVIFKVLLLVLSISAASVWAIPPEAERMRFVPVDKSKSFVEDQKYQSWLASMIDRQVVMEETGVQLVLHDQLASAFYSFSKENGWLPKGAEKEDVYSKSWLRANGLRSGMSSAEEFRLFVAKNGELRLLTETDLGNGNSAPKVVTSTTEADVAKVTALATQLTALQQRVEKSEKGGQVAASLKSDLAALERKLNTANAGSVEAKRAVKELKAGLQALRSGELTSKMANDINRKVGVHLNSLTKRVVEVEEGLADVSNKVDAMQMGSVPVGYMAVKHTFGEEAATSYANNRGWVYTALIMLLAGVMAMFVQLPQRRKNREVGKRLDRHSGRIAEVERALYGFDDNRGLIESTSRLVGGQVRLDNKLSDLTKQVEEQEQKFDEQVKLLWAGQIRTNGQIRQQKNKLGQLEEEVQDVLTLSSASVAVEFDSGNPGLEVLETLPAGSEHAVFWKGTRDEGHFTVKIWREDTTPVGLVETNIVRNADSGQLAEPIALKRLKKRIEAAVIDGRIPVVKLLTIVA
jgi:hypothetical protein